MKTFDGTRWTGGSDYIVNVRDFGAVGDGITDDTAAINSWIQYLSANGGSGVMPFGEYRITKRVLVNKPVKSFEINGETGGDGPPTIVVDSEVPTTAFELREATNSLIQNIKIMGKSTESSIVQGLVGVGCIGLTIRDVTLENYSSTGIMIYTEEPYRQGSYCTVENCTVLGKNIASNGILMTRMLDSKIINCNVSEISETGTPGYGLQFKNGCKRCQIMGGLVNSARVGVGFGNTSPGELTENCRAVGVTIIGCRNGLEVSNARNNSIEALIDGSSEYTTGAIASLGTNFTENFVKLSVNNIRSDSIIISMYGHNNYVSVDRINGFTGSNFIVWREGSSNNILDYRGREIDFQDKILDLSGNSTNFIKGF